MECNAPKNREAGTDIDTEILEALQLLAVFSCLTPTLIHLQVAC